MESPKKKRISQDEIISCLLCLFGILLYFGVNPKYVADTSIFMVSPRLVPNICAILLIVLSIPLFISGWRKRKLGIAKTVEFDKKGVVLSIVTVLAMICYYFVVFIIGYIPTTIVLITGLMILLGQRNWKLIVPCAILIPIATYFFFSKLLYLTMP